MVLLGPWRLVPHLRLCALGCGPKVSLRWRPWVWRHDFAVVFVDASVQPASQTLEPLAGAACHFCRQGWRAWVFEKWARSGRHLLFPRSIPLSSVPFGLTMYVLGCCPLPRLPLSVWVPPSLPPLGITFLALLGSSLRPWGCQSAGFWEHIVWSCHCRPAHAPAKPACAFLARFGWSLTTQNLSLTEVAKVRRWLAECQTAIWSAKDH